MQKTIHLAGGCFWGVEKYFSMVNGVVSTEVGYANGNFENPVYEQVYTGTTGFAEAIKIEYDDSIIDLDGILTHLYNIIDPTSLNAQGGDVGSHYRTGIYYENAEDKAIITASLVELQAQHQDNLIVVENLPLKNYYTAEERHQKYLDKNPDGYCHIPQYKYNEIKH
ncbi:MAG: peptide-methionine (S)-S-oxide reductase MsrA [Defluviitaleaceae bacterium]|nr:peptide-methionine (S)-S-oxide reductase MsrA [Defluviitaleaceae bacterium]